MRSDIEFHMNFSLVCVSVSIVAFFRICIAIQESWIYASVKELIYFGYTVKKIVLELFNSFLVYINFDANYFQEFLKTCLQMCLLIANSIAYMFTFAVAYPHDLFPVC